MVIMEPFWEWAASNNLGPSHGHIRSPPSASGVFLCCCSVGQCSYAWRGCSGMCLQDGSHLHIIYVPSAACFLAQSSHACTTAHIESTREGKQHFASRGMSVATLHRFHPIFFSIRTSRYRSYLLIPVLPWLSTLPPSWLKVAFSLKYASSYLLTTLPTL